MSTLNDAIINANTIAISGHIRPDGDCIGSTTAIYNYIVENYKDKQVDYLLEPFAASVSKCIDRPASLGLKNVDLFISLDCASKDRLGNAASVFDDAKVKYVIDHHKTNTGFGDINVIVPEASSACEVLYELLDDDKISLKTASSLYLGIVHDTGVFKYNSTSKKTMEIAGCLLDKGVNSAFIIDETFYAKSFKQNKLLARGLDKSVMLEDMPVIYTVITMDDLKEFGLTSADTDGIVEQLRLTDGVEIACFIRQDDEGLYKFSLRAKTGIIDVSTISVIHGGGGHKMAAGFSMNGSEEQVISIVMDDLRKLFEEAK